jgi:hypothetical protein
MSWRNDLLRGGGVVWWGLVRLGFAGLAWVRPQRQPSGRARHRAVCRPRLTTSPSLVYSAHSSPALLAAASLFVVVRQPGLLVSGQVVARRWAGTTKSFFLSTMTEDSKRKEYYSFLVLRTLLEKKRWERSQHFGGN